MSEIWVAHHYQMKKDETATYDEHAKDSTVHAGKGSVVIDAGSVEVIGSHIKADKYIVIDTDVGSITVKEAKEQHGRKEVHEELNIDLSLGEGPKAENGKVKVTIASASYDKTDLQEKSSTSASASLEAGGTVKLTSVEDIKI